MDCPTCGYVMDPFEAECPRCVREKAQGSIQTATLPVEPSSPDDQEVLDAINAAVPRVQARARREPEPIRYMPTLGWPLTVLLWLVIGLHSLTLLFIFAGSIPYRHHFVPSALNLVACIAMLYCRRWGFYLYGFFTVGPAILALFLGAWKDITLFISVAIAIAIFFMVLDKWREFD